MLIFLKDTSKVYTMRSPFVNEFESGTNDTMTLEPKENFMNKQSPFELNNDNFENDHDLLDFEPSDDEYIQERFYENSGEDKHEYELNWNLIKLPISDPVPFARTPKNGSFWPTISNHPRNKEVAYQKNDSKFVGNPSRRFLASRDSGKRFHVAIDLYANYKDPIIACEYGEIVSFYHFYHGAWALLVKHDDIVINYGEVDADSLKICRLKIGDKVNAGQQIGMVGRMKESSMLHFEIYREGVTENEKYFSKNKRPENLLNPSMYLLNLSKYGKIGNLNLITPRNPNFQSNNGFDINRAIMLNRKYQNEIGWNLFYDRINAFLLPFSGLTNVSLTEENIIRAVSNWQKSVGFSERNIDGVIGPETWKKMYPLLKIPSNGIESSNQSHQVPIGFVNTVYRGISGLKKSGKGLPRVDDYLTRLAKSGKITITNDEIDLLQRIANVETSGLITSFNSYDRGVVSIGFMQFTLHVGKIQEWIKLNPLPWIKYGIELDTSNRYFDELDGIKGVSFRDINKLRWGIYATSFFNASTDEEIIVSQVALAKKYLQRHIIGLKRRLKNDSVFNRFVENYYKKDKYVRGLFQASYNNHPAKSARCVFEVMNLPILNNTLSTFISGYKSILIKNGWARLVVETSKGRGISENENEYSDEYNQYFNTNLEPFDFEDENLLIDSLETDNLSDTHGIDFQQFDYQHENDEFSENEEEFDFDLSNEELELEEEYEEEYEDHESYESHFEENAVAQNSIIVWLKQSLNKLYNHSLPLTVKLDERTILLMNKFQRDNSLSITKKLNPQTERALLEKTASIINTGIFDKEFLLNAKSKIEDWTNKAIVVKSEITSTYRNPSQLFSLVLHQMAFSRTKEGEPSDPLKFLKIGAHFCILKDGRIIQLHPISRMIWHAQCLSHKSIGVEFEGNFPNIDGKWWKPKEAKYFQEDIPTNEQYESGKFLTQYLKYILGITNINAHRQSSKNRTNDPGPHIWKNIGEWAIHYLSLSDGGNVGKCGDGSTIDPRWRTYGESNSLIKEEFQFNLLDENEDEFFENEEEFDLNNEEFESEEEYEIEYEDHESYEENLIKDISKVVSDNRYYKNKLGWVQYFDQINRILLPYAGLSNISLGESDFALALSKWQASQGFAPNEADGVLGPHTWNKLKTQLNIKTSTGFGPLVNSSVSPVNDPVISSEFSNQRKHPVTGKLVAHYGIDIVDRARSKTLGKAVVSATDGTIASVKPKSDGNGAGNRIHIIDNAGYKHSYFHLSDNNFGSNIRAGAPVSMGQKIGEIGNTGRSSGPHLHYETVHPNGTKMNPRVINAGLRMAPNTHEVREFEYEYEFEYS